jgi:rod shape determining protein RodA
LPPRFWRHIDWFQLGLVLVAVAMGLVVVLGASGSGIHSPLVQYYAKRQVLDLVAGTITLALCIRIDYHAWTRWSGVLYAFVVFLLVVVFVIGHRQLGGQRWISVGGFDLQPSEFAKLAVIFLLARHLAGKAGVLRKWRHLIIPTALAALPAGLIVLEPDLGTSLVFVAILLGVLFAAGFPGWRLTAVTALVVALAVGAVIAHLRWGTPLPLHAYQLDRLIAFVNPQKYAQTAGWQVLQSELAVGSGGLHGTGLFSGGVNGQLSALSEAQTDFVFASVGNMAGFLGGVAVLAVLGLIFWRALAAMAMAGDAEGALIAGGIAAVLGFQILLNVGVTLGLLPVTGIPLPFVSYSGSATVVNFASIGILQSIRVRHKRIQF